MFFISPQGNRFFPFACSFFLLLNFLVDVHVYYFPKIYTSHSLLSFAFIVCKQTYCNVIQLSIFLPLLYFFLSSYLARNFNFISQKILFENRTQIQKKGWCCHQQNKMEGNFRTLQHILHEISNFPPYDPSLLL